MKKARKKLVLHRETITNLTGSLLSDVAGGGPKTNATICNSLCLTVCCPTNNSICITCCAGTCGTQTDCIGTAAC